MGAALKSTLRTYCTCLLEGGVPEWKPGFHGDRQLLYLCVLPTEQRNHFGHFSLPRPSSSQFALFTSNCPRRQRKSDAHAVTVSAWLLLLSSVFLCHPSFPHRLSYAPLLLSLSFCLSVFLSPIPVANIEQYESPVCAKGLQQQPKRQGGGGKRKREREGKKRDEKRVARPAGEERG